MNKTELIEKYRDINVDYDDWSDYVQEEFKADMKLIGIDVDRIYYSGFWSQGDGACFEGSVDSWPLVLKALGYDDNTALVALADDNWSFGCKHSGRYWHEHSVSYDDDMPNPDGETDEWFLDNYCPYDDVLRCQAWLELLRPVDYAEIKRHLKTLFEGKMLDLYHDLEKEYDYLTSDEAVWDAIQGNAFDDELDEGEL